MRFVVVRHAQSENNRRWADPDAQLHPDPALTPLGVRQAESLGAWASAVWGDGWRPTHVYASQTRRAAATAGVLGEALGLPVVASASLHEVEADEEPSDAAARARAVLASLRGTHGSDDVVAVVTHVRFAQELLRDLLGVGPGVWFRSHNTGVSFVDERPGLPCPVEVHALNSTAHLSPADVTG